METTVVSISFPKKLLQQIDQSRGLVSRSAYVCQIVRQHLQQELEPEKRGEPRSVTRRVEDARELRVVL